MARTAFPDLYQTLGPLDAGNSLTNQFTIKAIVNVWGAINDISLITKENAKPTICFHGGKDSTCPYDVGHFYVCDNLAVSYGSKPIYEKLTSLNVPAVFNFDSKGGHIVYSVNFRAENTACFLNSVMSKQPITGYFTGTKGNCR